MPMQTFGDCPWCGAKIELIKKGRVWVCPVCACSFTRQAPRWKVGIPLAGGAATLIWLLLPTHAMLVATLAAIGILMVTSTSGRNSIETRGRADLTAGEARSHRAQWKESKWFLVAAAIVLAAVLAGGLFWLMAGR